MSNLIEVSMKLSDKTVSNVNEILVNSNMDNGASVVANSVELFKMLIEHINSGGDILLKNKSGIVEKLTIRLD